MRIRANGIGINYDLAGPADAPVVAMCHSLGSSRVMWDPQLAELSQHWRVLRLDMRGHGLSDAPEGEYDLDMLGDDVVAVLDGLGIGQVHFVGLSIGGMIGQNLGLRHAGRLLSLAICDSSSAVPAAARGTWDERIDTATIKGMAALEEGTLERWFTPGYRQKAPAGMETIRLELLNTPVAGYVGCCHAIKQLNYTDRLPEIDLPTVVIVGRDDPGTPVAASEVIAEAIPGAELVVLDDAAHISNVEQADAFNAALVSFLKAQ